MAKLFTIFLLLISGFVVANTPLTVELRYQYLRPTGTDSMLLRVELVNYYSSYITLPNSSIRPTISVYETKKSREIVLRDTLRIESITEELPNFSPSTSTAYSLYKVVFSDTFAVPNTATGYTLYYRENPLYGRRVSLSSAACAVPPNTAQHTMREHSLAGYHAMAMGETFVINAQSTDKDGDSLTYEFAPVLYNNLSSYERTPDVFDSSKLFWPMGDVATAASNLGGDITLNASGQITCKSTNPVGVLFGFSVTEWRNGAAIATYYKQILLYSVLPKNPDNAYIDLWGNSGPNGTVLSWYHSLNGSEVFTVERRIDTGIWVTLGTVSSQNYWKDNQIFTDTILRSYRIRATGKKNSQSVKVLSNQWSVGGKKTALKVANPFKTKEIRVFPNPTTNTFFIETEDPLSAVVITDLAGKTVLHEQYIPTQGIDVSGLGVGTYIVQVITSGGFRTLRIIKN